MRLGLHHLTEADAAETWDAAETIIAESIPAWERPPTSEIMKDAREGGRDVFVLVADFSTRPSATVVTLRLPMDYVYLEFLAVEGPSRGRGLGSLVIQQLKSLFCGQAGIFFDIEDPSMSEPDSPEMRRFRFFSTSGAAPFGDGKLVVPAFTSVRDQIRLQPMYLPLHHVTPPSQEVAMQFWELVLNRSFGMTDPTTRDAALAALHLGSKAAGARAPGSR